MEKFKVLFDAEIILDVKFASKTGAGIYYATDAIYQELMNNKAVDVTLYSSQRHFGKLQFALDKNLINPKCKIIKLSKVGAIIAGFEYFRFKSVGKYGKFFFARVIRFIIRTCLQKPLQILETKLQLYKKEADDFDIYYSPIYKVPEHLEKHKIKKHVFLYDAIPLAMPDKYKGMLNKNGWFRQLIEQINHNDYYFTDSVSAKEDFLKYIPEIDEKKVTPVLLAADKKFYPCHNGDREVREKYNIPQGKKYFLSLCTIEPRKNIVFAVRNFIKFIKRHTIDDLIFVVAGGHWKEFSNSILSHISEIEGSDKLIIPTGYIDNCDLAALYSNAECFVYPSIYEGFGLPPLEAMQCGTPVITSNVSSLPEVVGDAGLMIDPQDDEAIINAYESIYFDKTLKKDLSARGLERAKLFSWKKCTDQMVDTFIKSLKEE